MVRITLTRVVLAIAVVVVTYLLLKVDVASPTADAVCTVNEKPKTYRAASPIKQFSSSFGAHGVLGLAPDGTILSRQDVGGPSTNDIVAVEKGRRHALAITKDATVLYWSQDNSETRPEVDSRWPDMATAVNEVERGVFRIPPLADIVAISAGGTHSLALTHQGDVWAWGANDVGQLGRPSDAATSHITGKPPRLIQGLNGVVAVTAGERHSVALKRDGTVWQWGNDTYSHIDAKDMWIRGERAKSLTNSTPTQVEGLTEIVQIAAGSQFTMAIKADGTLWAWGSNSCGQLGRPAVWREERLSEIPALVHPQYEYQPIQVSGITDVVAVAAGSYHVIALTRDGRVWTWGSNQFGALGLDTHGRPSAGVCVGSDSRAFTPPPAPYFSSPFAIASLTDAVAVSAGSSNSFVIHRDGTLTGWGACGDCLCNLARPSAKPLEPLEVRRGKRGEE